MRGSLHGGRGIDLIASLAEANEGLAFVVAGRDDGSAATDRLRALSNVTMVGQVPHRTVPAILAACDILLAPYEAAVPIRGVDFVEVMSPMKIAEYMASARAIIASDLPAVRRIMDSGTALFCAPGDLDAWQAALSKLQSDAGLRLQLGKAAVACASGRTWVARVRHLSDAIWEKLSSR